MKRLQLLFHNVGLGDVLTCAPLVLLALDHQFAVELVYETCAVPEVIPFLGASPLWEKGVRFVKKGAQRGASDSDVAVVCSHRALGDVWKCGRGASVLCVPLPMHRQSRMALYNLAVVPALRLRGLRPRPIRANPGRSIGRMMLEDFAEHIGAAPDYNSLVPRVRALLPQPRPGTSRLVVVHLFRDHPLRRLEDSTLTRIVESLAGALPARAPELLILFDPGSSFERHAAEHFAAVARSNELGCRLLPGPALEEAARLTAAAFLYVGVDHGISQLAGLLGARSLILYGGHRRHSDVHLIWRPVMEADPAEQSPHVSLMRSGERAVALVHPARAEYIAHRPEDSALINLAASRENLDQAFPLLGFSRD